MKTYNEMVNEIRILLIEKSGYDNAEYRFHDYAPSLENGDGETDENGVEIIRFGEYVRCPKGYIDCTIVEYSRLILDEDGDIIDSETIGYEVESLYWHSF